jgi:hypothetical protein
MHEYVYIYIMCVCVRACARVRVHVSLFTPDTFTEYHGFTLRAKTRRRMQNRESLHSYADFQLHKRSVTGVAFKIQ